VLDPRENEFRVSQEFARAQHAPTSPDVARQTASIAAISLLWRTNGRYECWGSFVEDHLFVSFSSSCEVHHMAYSVHGTYL
jgi:hypothetical protein